MLAPVTLAVEGTTDAAVARRLLEEAGLEPGPEYVKSGKGALDKSLAGYNNAARFSCWLALRDLDRDADCAPNLCRKLLAAPATHMRLHVAVRAIEAWLLADAKAVSDFFSIAQSKVPADPDALPFPKRALVDLARGSRRRTIREALVPAPGTTASVGPGYTPVLIEYATEHWRPGIAARRSPSLARLRDFLRQVTQRRSE